ncbi:D-alanine--D-alanine ligase family protein [Gordonia sp. PS3]|uniref:D-alanine--D-alanine ligase n=1 Tax=Gordonia sihwensis NBRC 108236 TaxID=1223544 RepID=L7LLP0_9ACTN|nr:MULTISPECIES: D-alanine--D-alanine ligase family protein [Gordonia]AUH70038.1 D-alanine--D-alanine ligase A [Gordonia sp. YC-JH1]KJR06721.1 D-alanine--D-alanine ligase [Gordonia sihwensis]KXT58369.1 D-alanine--D-alanine ligase [Gordonia sp. QH-12]MBY4568962.1 D-alanine--D-alanine ligase A [Gordonia sihwensis]WFN93092.1 D-alanine--D-alanine ligase [Gordonia sihwensis]
MSTPLIRLVVLYGGVSAEHDVSRVSAAHVLAAADRSKYRLIPVGIDKRGGWHRNDAAAEALAAGAELPNSLDVEGPEVNPLQVLAGRPEDLTVVFPLLHGPHGEDGTVQGMLELFKLPYIGCGVLASAVCMDKAMAKEIAARAGIPQCKWITFRDGVDDARQVLADATEQLGLPVFVKPANMGSSVGVSRADSIEELDAAINHALRYDDVVVIEETVTGREVEVAVLGNAAPDASLPGEIKPGSDFYDYEDKYVTGAAELMIPAPLSDEAIAQVRELAADAFVALRCAGLARVDFFYEEDGRGWLLNEVNTIPGFTPASMYPKMWEATGITYPDLIDRLVTLALEVHRRRSSFSTEH